MIDTGLFFKIISLTIIGFFFFSTQSHKLICEPKTELENFKCSISENKSHTISNCDNQIMFAGVFEEEKNNSIDSTSGGKIPEEKSDLFYYILGIFILIASGFILKQRYAQYLKDK
jgi:hypothetical protein